VAKILIIDDSPSALSVMEGMLANTGHQVISRLSAKGAVHLAAQMSADLIITDLYMPDEDGLEVVRQARKVSPPVPVIVVSGGAGNKDLLGPAKLLGAAEVLRKPFSRQQLVDAVDRLLAAIATSGASPRETNGG
jgi:CheY-like chemotaxis protein